MFCASNSLQTTKAILTWSGRVVFADANGSCDDIEVSLRITITLLETCQSNFGGKNENLRPRHTCFYTEIYRGYSHGVPTTFFWKSFVFRCLLLSKCRYGLKNIFGHKRRELFYVEIPSSGSFSRYMPVSMAKIQYEVKRKLWKI